MTGRKKYSVWLCSVLAAFFLLTGCLAGQQVYVTNGEGPYVEYKHDDQSGATIYKDDSGSEEIRYIAKDDELIRVSPVRAHELAAANEREVLSPVDAEFKAALTAQQLEAFIGKYAPAELAFVAVQRLARPRIDARNWGAAADILRRYSPSFPGKTKDFDAIIATLEAPAEGLLIDNLGGGINSGEDEYNPVISSDGKKLYFARDCGECNGGEEVYVSRQAADGSWEMARRFGEPLSSKGHEIPLGVSSDGNTLAVYGNYSGSKGRGDIFYVEKGPKGWGGLQHYPAPLNSENFESNAMYTADGRAILFVSERPGGIGDFHRKDNFFHGSYGGNTDIYVYVDGQVINLGNVINTPYSEYSPFLHPDGKTLYFSSDGHPGLGGLDVFMATRLNNDSWTEWSEPVNLGKEVNTSHNDWGYQVAARADKAFFAVSNRGSSYGGSDIYTIGMPEKVKPVRGVITISGTVTDPAGDALVADIRWSDLSLEKDVGHASSDPITGEYVIHLPSGGEYGYYAEKEGYMGESEHFNLRESIGYQEFEMDIVLYPIEPPVEAKVVEEPQMVDTPVQINMNNIFFAFNKSELKAESRMEMKRWINMLNENMHIHLEVAGHADSIGTESYNQKLSQRRATAVVKYLTENGIARDRLLAKGFGESQPVADNKTEGGRQQNRRVQVKIINSTRK